MAAKILARKHDRENEGLLNTDGRNRAKREMKSYLGFKAFAWVTGCSYSGSEGNTWKPATLRAPVLGSFAAVSLLFIGTLEILAYYAGVSNNLLGTGNLVIAENGKLTAATICSYLYLPTVISVCYSMVWNWIELDVKRLEPWFQLSYKDGALAENSLLLHYPFDFLALVPFSALKRRHWSVFYGGMVTILIFWCITPLQSAIFTSSTVNRVRPIDVRTTSTLLPIDTQTSTMNNTFLSTSYAITWLNYERPAFTTAEYAMLPFDITLNSTDASSTAAISTNVDLYDTDLTCSPATISVNDTEFLYTFDNGKGCIVPRVELPDARSINASYLLLYYNYYGSYEGNVPAFQLQNPNCSSAFENNFLLVWATAASQDINIIYSNITALFCETSYSVQKGNVTIDLQDGAVTALAVENDMISRPLPRGVFNTTNFEFIIANGIQANLSSFPIAYPQFEPLALYPRVENYSVAYPFGTVVPFAIAGFPHELDQLVNTTLLVELFTNAHKSLFTIAFSSILTPITEGIDNITYTGYLRDRPIAITFSRIFSIVVEFGLALTTMGTTALWYHAHCRPSKLSHNPASIKDVMFIPRDSDHLCLDVEDDGMLSSEELERRLGGRRFALQRSLKQGVWTLKLKELSPLTSMSPPCAAARNSDGSVEPYRAVRPKELSLVAGMSLAITLTAAMCLLGYLYTISTKNQGIVRPSSNRIVLAILESFLPTLFATFLEPLWVVLNRLLCLLIPLEELRIGNARSYDSIEARYTSLPPQLNILNALRSRHFLLAAVCVAAASSNILAVSLSGLFNEASSHVTIPMNTTYQLSSTFSGTEIVQYTGTHVIDNQYSDHYYSVLANLSSPTPLPPWIDFYNYYRPFDLTTISIRGTEAEVEGFQQFQAVTRAFGIQPNCHAISSGEQLNDSMQTTLSFTIDPGYTYVNTSVNLTLDTGEVISCKPDFGGVWGPTTGANATFTSTNLMSRSISPCKTLILAAWARRFQGVPNASTTTNNTVPQSLEYRTAICNPIMTSALYNVTVDTAGRVLKSQQVSDLEIDLAPYFDSTGGSQSLLEEANSIIITLEGFDWRNDTVATDWFSYAMQKYMGSNAVSPHVELPDEEELISAFENIYQRLFVSILGLNPHLFAPSDGESVLGFGMVSETRIFTSASMVSSSIGILGFQLLVALWLYTRRPQRFLPRMPTSIGSLLAFVSTSRAVEDFADTAEAVENRQRERYGYGRFIGKDGKAHVGIERQTFVVPLKTKNPSIKKDRPWRIWRKPASHEHELWI